MRLAAALLGLALGSAALASDPDWPTRSGTESTAQLVGMFPESAAILRRNLGALVEAGSKDAANAELSRLADMGYALTAGTQEQLGDLVSADLEDRFAANALDRDEAKVEATIPAGFGLIESAVTIGSLHVASGVTAQDLLISKDGKAWHPLGLKGLGSLTGLVADPRRALVWASSSVMEPTPRPGDSFAGLVAVDPRRGKVVQQIAAPAGVTPSDLTLAPDGTLYASDPLGGGVWRARRGAAVLEPLVPAGLLRSPQGLALSADGKRLYASDYGYGLAVIDLPGGKVRRLAAARPMMLDGIDGLLRHGNELIAIQNGTRPMRIVAVSLSPDGTQAASLRVLWQRLPDEGEPTAGELRGGRLRYVANARWDLYGKGGALAEGGRPGDTEVHSLALSPN